MKAKKPDEIIHVKLDYDEAVRAKQTVLLTEQSLIYMIKALRKFRDLRKEELMKKQKLRNQLTDFAKKLNKLQKMFPQIQNPEDKKKKKKEKDPDVEALETKIEKVQKQRYDRDLEEQLSSIQERLRNIGG